MGRPLSLRGQYDGEAWEYRRLNWKQASEGLNPAELRKQAEYARKSRYGFYETQVTEPVLRTLTDQYKRDLEREQPNPYRGPSRERNY